MTGAQSAMLAGSLIGMGCALLLWHAAPAHLDLGQALTRLDPMRPRARRDTTTDTGRLELKDRIGLAVMRSMPTFGWVPTTELAMLRMPVHRYWGEKAVFALIGLLFPPLMAALALMANIDMPIAVPAFASILLAIGFSFIPDYNVRSDAKNARGEFSLALNAYVDMVALERNAGASPRQALEHAAQVGDSWVFTRLEEELARSQWAGVTPWEALEGLATELMLPELRDLADIMRRSGHEGAAVYESLRARSQSMRTATLNRELAKSHEVAEKMTFPITALGLIFMVLLLVPALLRIIGQ